MKVEVQKKIYHAYINQRKAWVTIVISDKVDFSITKITRHREEHYIMIKASIYQENKAMLNVYAPNNKGTIWSKVKWSEVKWSKI